MSSPDAPNDADPRITGRIPSAQMRLRTTGRKRVRDMSPSSGPHQFSFGLAKVVEVDYENLEVTLEILTGEDERFRRIPIAQTFPGAGPRHFLGAIPEEGSYCMVGWAGGIPTRIAVIVSWLIPGVQMGYDWLTTQEFGAREFDFNPRHKAELEGIYVRARHKLRHMQPGNIVLSSSQGSDICLDEGVYLCNRRCNEIRLRDQDQALVTRSLQRFDVQGGVRAYTGMVQRDATFLPRQMVSDGVYWDSPRQTIAGIPIGPDLLGENPDFPDGTFTPEEVFVRGAEDDAPTSGMRFSANLDPYDFCSRGMFITQEGEVRDPDLIHSEVEYGGKQYFRVSLPNPDGTLEETNNAAIATNPLDAETLTEWRIEIDHTWDGTLPASEQTDGFDADRIPDQPQDSTNQLTAGNRPYIEFVMGSVVGNAAFSGNNRELYGLPLRPIIFDSRDGEPRPTMESAVGVDLGEHAATMFRVEPPLNPNLAPTFWSVNKNGQFKGFLSGPQEEDSVEVFSNGGIHVEAGGVLTLKGRGGLVLDSPAGNADGNFGFDFKSETGAIRLRANGATTEGVQSALSAPGGGSESTLPSLILESPTGNAHLTGGRNVKIAAGQQIQLAQSKEVRVTPQNLLSILTDKFATQVNTLDRTVSGQESTVYSGPKSALPTNLPLRSTRFTGTPLTGHIGGKTDEYFMWLGDRKEKILIGNHDLFVGKGNIEFFTAIGRFQAGAGFNNIVVSTTSGISTLSVTTTNIQSTVSTTVQGGASVTLKSAIGPATVSGSVVKLGAKPGQPFIPPVVGSGIVSSTDLDPLSGLPLLSFRMGSTTHRLTPAIA